MADQSEKIQKVSLIISRGALEGIYPPLIMANGARMEGIEVNLLFTFYGLYGVLKKYMGRLKVATVGNPALRVPSAKGMRLPALLGAVPGISGFATRKMKRGLEELDIPPLPEFIERIHDAGGKIYACKATADLFRIHRSDFCPQVSRVLTIAEFFEIAGGGQIIYT
jgi:peroxiredoxin family protein